MGAEVRADAPQIFTFQYWGGVVDNARVAVRSGFQDLSLLSYLLRKALQEVDTALERRS